jgi:hypothetical protein
MIKLYMVLVFVCACCCVEGVVQVDSAGSAAVREGIVQDSLTSARVRGRVELFLDSENILSTSGTSRSINTPTKHASNPIMGTKATDTWDDDKPNGMVLREGSGSWKMYYTGRPEEYAATNFVLYTCYSTSTNGIDWVKPDMGITNYNGSSSNNILGVPTSNRYFGGEVKTHDYGYIMMTAGSLLLRSVDGLAWTYVDDIMPTGEDMTTWISHSYAQMRDESWRTYSQYFISPIRHAGIAFCDAGNYPTNTFTPRPNPLEGVEGESTTEQIYFLKIFYHEGNWLGFAPAYNDTTEMQDVDLYFSRNGYAWAKAYNSWLPLGSGGQWDSKQVRGQTGLHKEGNLWHFYYNGSDRLHNDFTTFNYQIGLSTIGYERIGQIGTTGTALMRPVIATGALLINADASGGTLTAALFNADTGVVLTGYDYADFDAISSDTYETEGAWGGASMPKGVALCIGFTLSNATLYSYSAGVPDSQVIE